MQFSNRSMDHLTLTLFPIVFENRFTFWFQLSLFKYKCNIDANPECFQYHLILLFLLATMYIIHECIRIDWPQFIQKHRKAEEKKNIHNCWRCFAWFVQPTTDVFRIVKFSEEKIQLDFSNCLIDSSLLWMLYYDYCYIFVFEVRVSSHYYHYNYIRWFCITTIY